ncbi:MAG: NUDIX hydrolase [Dehalococcoidia bacterium]|nr:MAG: NUDIX hydrolase [Dehalococcoidia bacterium]
MNRYLRKRATAVILRGGKVLLVRHRGQSQFSLPGGGMRISETVLAAIERELYKELKLEARNIKRLEHCDFNSVTTRHHICVVEAEGEPIPRRLEVAKYIWWDMKEHIPIFPHVRKTLSRILSKPLPQGI